VDAFEVKVEQIREQLEYLQLLRERNQKRKDVDSEDDATQRRAEKVLERSLRQIYRTLLMLDNYAKLNYAAIQSVLYPSSSLPFSPSFF